MSDHLSEILTEALDDFKAHLRLAKWLAESEEPRLQTFFSQFQNLPLPYKMADAFAYLVNHPHPAEIEPWLANFCRQTAEQVSPYIRPWHLFAAAWYAAAFNPAEGLPYLQSFSAGGQTLSPEANKTLTDLAEQVNGSARIGQAIAGCPDPQVKVWLGEFGHPDLAAVVAARLGAKPDYSHLARPVEQAAGEAARFKRNLSLLSAAELRDGAEILDLACGPLAAQTILLHSAGYQVIGADLHLPPSGWPLVGLKGRLKRGRHIKAWQRAGQPYYAALAQAAGRPLNWKKVRLALVDLTRLHFTAEQFDVVLCCNHLQHAPDVAGLLAEAARVLKPGGLFLADLRPYPALSGSFAPAPPEPWSHLIEPETPAVPLNKWSEGQYRTALEEYFTLEQWLTEPDPEAVTWLTPQLTAQLAPYTAEELTRREVVMVARK